MGRTCTCGGPDEIESTPHRGETERPAAGNSYVVLSLATSIGTCVVFQSRAMNGDMHAAGSACAGGGSGYGPGALPLQMAATVLRSCPVHAQRTAARLRRAHRARVRTCPRRGVACDRTVQHSGSPAWAGERVSTAA